MGYTIEQIAKAVGAEVHGRGDLVVTGAAEPAQATEDHLALAMKPEYAETLSQGRARAAVLWADADWQSLGLEAAILTPRSRFAMSGLTSLMDPGNGWEDGIHPSAVVDPTAELGEGVSVGPLSVIGPRAKIGAGTAIGPQCTVGAEAVIGENGQLREGVRIAARVKIGARFIAQPGAVIGGDGFSFVTPEVSHVENYRSGKADPQDAKEQKWVRIHSLGSVTIGDDVEIGTNSAVDRGTIRDTVIGDRTKLDNLVMVAHNVQVGTDTLLCGHVGIAGSAKIGNNVVLGGKAGVSDNVFVGDNVIAGGSTVILANVPAGRVVLGYLAMKIDTTMDIFKNLRRLKRLFADVSELKKTVSNRNETD